MDASTALARFDQMVTTLHNEQHFLAPLRNQEALLSSRIEGTISTLDEILEYEAESEGEEESDEEQMRRARADVIETILYRRALVAAQEAIMEGRPLNSSLIKSMHQQLLSYGRGAGKSPGEFKHEQNYIGERSNRKISFVPIAPELLEAGLESLFSYVESSDHQALVRIALAHLEFEALHPFKDGNGRIGRMLVTLLLWQTKSISSPHFFLSQFFEENKNAYLAHLRGVSEKGEWNEWCLFFLEAVRVQAGRNLETLETVRDLYDEMKIRFEQVLSSKYASRHLDSIFTSPVFRNRMLSKASGIPIATVNRFTRALVEEGYVLVSRQGAGRRPTIYTFEPLVDVLRV